MKTVRVDLRERSYDILIGPGLLPETGPRVKALTRPSLAVIITDEHVAERYGDSVRRSLEEASVRCIMASIPAGETSKTLEMAHRLYDDLAEARADRTSTVLALGGGVVGDLAGFVAATYMRGIPYVQVPTTLLADVDSSIGGKVAVNHPREKNLIGAFYQPRLVLIDLDTLDSLPEAEFSAGMVEVIKYGVIRDAELFASLEETRERLRDRQKDHLASVIERCCRIKAEIVAADETESGLRAVLNFGHTIAHALESLAQYGTYRHGEAVAVGMIAACLLSERLAGLDRDHTRRLRDLLAFFDAPSRVAGLSPEAVLDAMLLDKKALRGRLRFILAEAIGTVCVREDVPDAAVLDCLREVGCE
ncbi:MAG: 3-dehydroquinate synthase [Planctomycetota bacterium]